MAVTARIKKFVCSHALLLRRPISHQHLFPTDGLFQMQAPNTALQVCYPHRHGYGCFFPRSTFNINLTLSHYYSIKGTFLKDSNPQYTVCLRRLITLRQIKNGIQKKKKISLATEVT